MNLQRGFHAIGSRCGGNFPPFVLGFRSNVCSSRGNVAVVGARHSRYRIDHYRHMTTTSRSTPPQHCQKTTSVFPHSTFFTRALDKVKVAHFCNLACNNFIKSSGKFETNQTHNFNLNELRTFATKMSGKGPGLIVFDLDCTLWPLHVDTTVNPPFIKKDSKIVDQDGKLITYYPEVPEVLEYLKNEGYSIGVASRTTKPPGAEQLLDFFDWNKYISYKEIYPGSKVTHFSRFVEKTGLSHKEMLFFDDEQRNITDMEKEGVKCVLVQNGVDLSLVKDSIEHFKAGKL